MVTTDKISDFTWNRFKNNEKDYNRLIVISDELTDIIDRLTGNHDNKALRVKSNITIEHNEKMEDISYVLEIALYAIEKEAAKLQKENKQIFTGKIK